MPKIAVISGANRGLGLGASRALANLGYTVVMLGRDITTITTAANNISKDITHPNGKVLAKKADIAVPESILQLAKNLNQKFDHIDVLINNAGVLLDKSDAHFATSSSILDINPELIINTMQTNTFGALRLTQALVPLLKKSPAGRIVNVSSGMGQLSNMESGWPAYRISKTALNAITRILAAEFQAEKSMIKINSITPGWVRTDMGGPSAPRTIEEGIKGIIWAATLPADGPSGGFFRDGEVIEW